MPLISEFGTDMCSCIISLKAIYIISNTRWHSKNSQAPNVTYVIIIDCNLVLSFYSKDTQRRTIHQINSKAFSASEYQLFFCSSREKGPVSFDYHCTKKNLLLRNLYWIDKPFWFRWESVEIRNVLIVDSLLLSSIDRSLYNTKLHQ